MSTAKLERWAKKNPIEAAGAVVAVVLLATSIPTLLKSVQNGMAVREFSAEQQKSSEMAKQIFSEGCEFVFAESDPTKATTLTLNAPVIDAARKVPFPPGVKVCGFNGTAGVINLNSQGEPVVTELYYTGDRQVVEDALKKQGFIRRKSNATRQDLPPNLR